MHVMTQEWVDTAETDYATVSLLVRAGRMANVSRPVCFHSHQCVERYLKAQLVEAAVPFSKTHDLALLLTMVGPVEPSWASAGASLGPLDGLAVSIRYPGVKATRSGTAQAVRTCRQWRTRVRRSLGL